ncbi:MAG: hypothetical protein AB7E47_14050 [Desulfovibrionaceae bacterium]
MMTPLGGGWPHRRHGGANRTGRRALAGAAARVWCCMRLLLRHCYIAPFSLSMA